MYSPLADGNVVHNHAVIQLALSAYRTAFAYRTLLDRDLVPHLTCIAYYAELLFLKSSYGLPWGSCTVGVQGDVSVV